MEKLTSIAADEDDARKIAYSTVRESLYTYERDVSAFEHAESRRIFGSVPRVPRRVEEYVDAGVTHFELKFIYSNVEALRKMMILFANTVIPSFR